MKNIRPGILPDDAPHENELYYGGECWYCQAIWEAERDELVWDDSGKMLCLGYLAKCQTDKCDMDVRFYEALRYENER